MTNDYLEKIGISKRVFVFVKKKTQEFTGDPKLTDRLMAINVKRKINI